MEHRGIPTGYDRYRIVTQFRNPFTRMESLFKYMSKPPERGDTNWKRSCVESTAKGFEHWLLYDRFQFANPHTSDGGFNAYYTTWINRPDQDKSQVLWADVYTPAPTRRPIILKDVSKLNLLRYEHIAEDAKALLDIEIEHTNQSENTDADLSWSSSMLYHMETYHSWDMIAAKSYLPMEGVTLTSLENTNVDAVRVHYRC